MPRESVATAVQNMVADYVASLDKGAKEIYFQGCGRGVVTGVLIMTKKGAGRAYAMILTDAEEGCYWDIGPRSKSWEGWDSDFIEMRGMSGKLGRIRKKKSLKGRGVTHVNAGRKRSRRRSRKKLTEKPRI